MPAPVVAGLMAKPAVDNVVKALSHPVVGWKQTRVKLYKKRQITTEKTIQLRGWELGNAVLGVGALVAGSYALRLWRWKEHGYTYPAVVEVPEIYYDNDSGKFKIRYTKTTIQKEVRFHLPAANTEGGKDCFGVEVPFGLKMFQWGTPPGWFLTAIGALK